MQTKFGDFMGRYVEIKKIASKNSSYYYEVFSWDYPGLKPFYIGIDSVKKTISYFETDDFAQSDYVYDLTNLPREIIIDWIPHFFTYATLYKAKQALENMNFGEYISFQS